MNKAILSVTCLLAFLAIANASTLSKRGMGMGMGMGDDDESESQATGMGMGMGMGADDDESESQGMGNMGMGMGDMGSDDTEEVPEDGDDGADDDGHFSYDHESTNGPANWGGICETPDLASPIDLTGAQSASLPSLDLSYVTETTALVNNGHTLVFARTPENNTVAPSNLPFIVRPGVEDRETLFHLAQIHLHWGSEHFENGVQFPLEAHLVHFNSAYGSVGEALNHADGLLVIGVFYEVSDAEETPGLAAIASEAAEVEVNAGDLLPANTDYYTYAGGLTTPPCSEVVTWVVMREKMPVSQSTLDAFAAVTDSHDHPISDHGNYRPLQPMDGRVLYVLDN